MTEEELGKKIDSFNQGIEQLKEDVQKKADSEEIQKKLDDLNGKYEELPSKEVTGKQQEQLDQIATDVKVLGEKQGKTEKTNLQTIEEKLDSDEYKNAIKKAGKETNQIYGFDLKTVGSSDIASNTDILNLVEPGVAKHPWKQTPVWDAIPKGIIGQGSNGVSWMEENSRADNAEMLANNGEITTESTITWNKNSLDITHVGAYTKVERSALEDWELTRSEIMDLLQNILPRKVETQLIDGTGSNNQLTGLVSQIAKSFSKPSNFSTVLDANYIDAHRAVMTQIMNGDTDDANKKGYMANMNFVNQGDLMNLRGMKDQNYGYIIPPLGDGVTNIDGVRWAPGLDLAGDEFLMCDISQAKIFLKRNMEISLHYENGTDVLKDLVTIVARMRLAGVRVKKQHKYAFVKGSFNTVKTAIEEATA